MFATGLAATKILPPLSRVRSSVLGPIAKRYIAGEPIDGLVGMIDVTRGRQLFHVLDIGGLCFGLAAVLDLASMTTW